MSLRMVVSVASRSARVALLGTPVVSGAAVTGNHCLDAETGQCCWIHDAECETWGSTLVADGRVYMPTAKGLWVLEAGKQLKPLGHISLGGKVYASPVTAHGTLYVATTHGWLWAACKQ